MKSELERLLREALRSLVPGVLPEAADPTQVVVERARDAQHGDFASNIAMRLAKAARRKPRELAQAIVDALPANPLIARAEVAGAGFINFRLVKDAWLAELRQVALQGEAYGRSNVGAGRKVMVEFVSANPTGPMHVGHGRQAAVGATLSNLLAATGHDLYREYYINDAGRQIDILAVSVYLRYLELCGERVTFPSNGYRAGYILPVVHALRAQRGDALRRPAAEVMRDVPPDAPAGDKDKHIDGLIENSRRLLGAQEFDAIVLFARDAMLADIRNDLDEFRVHFDRWFSERELNQSGAVDRAIEALRNSGHMYVKDGAEWFRSTDYGDDEDRVVIRANGEKTYFASDIAYHYDKRQRGHDLLIDVWGADHHGYVARVRGALQALGAPGDCFEVMLLQLVSLFRGGEKLSMGKREGNFVTLRDLRNEVGNDACRFFYLMRSHDQALDFDLELAKSRSNENPVYYVQYAHARVCSVMKELAARSFTYDAAAGSAALARLDTAHEQAVITSLTKYPEIVERAALDRTPHSLVHYLRDLANTLHTYYNAEKWIVEDADLRNARLTLVLAVQQVIRNGLGILG
ncbi:MAG TPA: arginine--tRNA ligase, partial [Steroidobacteraceae bacterium]|nr:arginine--tRNA ligase [Steroidobacteraceae bacterium]